MIYMLDACALIAFLDKEEGFEKVEDVLYRSKTGEHSLYMHRINLIEVYYGYIRDKGVKNADAYMEPVGDYPVNIISDISDFVYRRAAFIKGTYHIALGDSIACAAAMSLAAILVTADHGDLEKIQDQEKLPMYWIRSKPYNA
jgi:predicted nucleic acid-binding protein